LCLIQKLLSPKKERDGMQTELESGRNASRPSWHVPHSEGQLY
jgi:hypothetical protein